MSWASSCTVGKLAFSFAQSFQTPSQPVFRHEFREVMCDVEVDELDALMDRSAGIIRHLSYHEERHNLEQLQLRPVCGNLAIVDVSEGGNVPELWWATARYAETLDTSHFGSTLRGGEAVWSRLLEATSSRGQCANPPCRKVSTQSHPWACFQVMLGCSTPGSQAHASPR